MTKKKTTNRGRKKGSVSFARIKLNDLNKFLGPDADIIVSIRWSKHLGLNTKPVDGNTTTLKTYANGGKPLEIKVSELD